MLQEQLRSWLGVGGNVLWRWQSDFPDALRHIPDPPTALFYEGNLQLLAQPTVALVGSRAATTAGAACASTLAAELSAVGVVVVSGLAQGIDRAAHSGALAVGGRTVAIPGSGLQQVYPRAHRPLARRILALGGLLLSEYPPWVRARRSSFPARNRLISGLAAGVVVVQAALRSGSLITARLAAEQGREVMAVPGAPGLAVSRGCNQLLRDGAALVESVADVFATLGWVAAPAAASVDVSNGPDRRSLSRNGRLVLAALDGDPSPLDALAGHVGLAPAVVQAELLELELAGFVRASARGYIRHPDIY